MSTLAVTNLKHPNATTASLVLTSGGNVTGAGLDLITSQTYSAVSGVSVNDCFTSTYENYRIVINSTAVSTANITRIRMRAAGSDATGNIYYFSSSRTQWNAAQNVWYTRGNPLDYIYLHENDDTTNDAARGAYDIYSPQKTTVTTLAGMAIRTAVGVEYGGAFVDATTAYDGFTLYVQSGTFTGQVRVYGYRD